MRFFPIVNALKILICFFNITAFSGIYAQSNTSYRFPRPEFQNEYTQPQAAYPQGRSPSFDYIDVFLLFFALCLAAYLTIIKRSRRYVFLLMIVCLLYFGFYKKGCICPIGSIQNISLALFNPEFRVTLTTGLIFFLPLIFSLLFGRVFCSSVCPLGGIQDLVLIKPITIPIWLKTVLRFIPYVYLALAVLFASTGAGFIICQFDPFVGIFRRSASFSMILFGILFLGAGTVVARPYCRFLCPYSILLGWMSFFSKWHVSVTPDICIKCRLCEKACPFEAINTPRIRPSLSYQSRSIKQFYFAVILMPLLIFTGMVAGRSVSKWISLKHPTVRLAEQILREDNMRTNQTTEESRTFREGSTPVSELVLKARGIK
ncbi:MAG: 4Fe-4S binding protein, partial [Chitinispirillia bacterium]